MSIFDVFSHETSALGSKPVKHRLWAADPHQFGPGKIHIVDAADASKTFCGRFLSAIPGRVSESGQPTCRICLDRVVRRPEQERQAKEWERRRQEQEKERQREREEWHARYATYLKSPEWAARRAKVMMRAGGMCEGCLESKATQVHHLTYEHVGAEFMWELRAICRACHERLHGER